MSLSHRRDVRSTEQFKADIKAGTARERKLLEFWVDKQRKKGHIVTYTDNGIDNSGEFIEGKTNNDPDFSVTLDGETFLCEIKANELKHRNSFKVYDLKTYIRQNARILLFYDLGREMCNIERSQWAYIMPDKQQLMLDTLEHVKTDRAWGYKPIVIVRPEMYDTFFTSYTYE